MLAHSSSPALQQMQKSHGYVRSPMTMAQQWQAAARQSQRETVLRLHQLLTTLVLPAARRAQRAAPSTQPSRCTRRHSMRMRMRRSKGKP